MTTVYTYILILFLAPPTFSAQEWKLLFENDANGKAVIGNIEALAEAIRGGKELRIYFKMGGSDRYVEHTADVKFTTILNDSSGIVITGQIDPIIGQTPNYENGTVKHKENLEWSLIASTWGKNDTMMRNVISGEIVSHQIVEWGTRWFCKE